MKLLSPLNPKLSTHFWDIGPNVLRIDDFSRARRSNALHISKSYRTIFPILAQKLPLEQLYRSMKKNSAGTQFFIPKSRGESHFQPSVVCSIYGSLCHFPLLFFSQNFGYNYHLTWRLQTVPNSFWRALTFLGVFHFSHLCLDTNFGLSGNLKGIRPKISLDLTRPDRSGYRLPV